MLDTSPSLLDRLSRRPDDADWARLVSLYTPVLRAWLGRAIGPVISFGC